MTYINTISELLKDIEDNLVDFISKVEIIEFRNDRSSGIFVVTHPYRYRKDIIDDLKQKQIQLLSKYSDWKEHFDLLRRNISEDTNNEIKTATEFIKNQIELNSDWSTESTPDKNIANISKRFKELDEFLDLFKNKEPSTVFIPDTNSLIISPDFELYKTLKGDKFTILLTPTVLSELDKLKITHHNEAFREKVKSVIKRIKGLRTQGSLLSGVTVHKSITIKMIATEPNFDNTLSWLDRQNNDDRFIASVIEYQVKNPSDCVYLISSDINLQNKAEMAKVPYFETPSK